VKTSSESDEGTESTESGRRGRRNGGRHGVVSRECEGPAAGGHSGGRP